MGAMTKDSRVQALVEKARLGDRDAFDDLVRCYETHLRSSVERQIGPGAATAEVDDVVQETFVLAIEAIGRFKGKDGASFSAWLLRIARNVFIDHVKDAHRSRYLELPDRLSGNSSSPSRMLRRDERFDRLEKAIAQLPPDYREVLRGSQLERLKVKEIARRMNRSEYAVKHLVARALHKLRE